MTSLKGAKARNKWKIDFPKALTEEELKLKSKYEYLNTLKQRLKRFEITGKCEFLESKRTKVKKIKMTVSEGQSKLNSKKTCEFKKPSTQNVQIRNKRSFREYSFEDDTQPRSIIIKGRELTNAFLHSTFDNFGFIWKIRSNDDQTSSILSFKLHGSARAAVEAMNGRVVNGSELKVLLKKAKNTSWCNSENSDQVFQEQSRGRTVHVFLTGFLSSNDIEEFFQTVGRVTRIYLNNRKRFGFVTFETEEQAQRAARETSQEIYKGVKIIVSPQYFYGADKLKPGSSEEQKLREIVTYDDVQTVA